MDYEKTLNLVRGLSDGSIKPTRLFAKPVVRKKEHPIALFKNVVSVKSWKFQKWKEKKAAEMGLTIEQFNAIRARNQNDRYHANKIILLKGDNHP
jgi:hypothetical protein